MATWISSNPFGAGALASAAIAAILGVWYLVRKPESTRTTKIALLFGIGVLPLATAATGNVSGYEAMKSRNFCGSCHVMTPYSDDSSNPESKSLASRHARNEMFGHDNCYACHADYGMFGTIVTKLGGLRHVYEYTFNYRNMSLEEARKSIHIRKPFQNATCMHCHSTELPLWRAVPEHASLTSEIASGRVSCASAGCHGPSHPFSKDPVVPVVDPGGTAPTDPSGKVAP
ncbi:MAG: NapC/NirT family cytochrome c [Proteobacteria bacterium]|nr:NapC/NirT family cytochrome c [Pseudomonadota bacterium]